MPAKDQGLERVSLLPEMGLGWARAADSEERWMPKQYASSWRQERLFKGVAEIRLSLYRFPDRKSMVAFDREVSMSKQSIPAGKAGLGPGFLDPKKNSEVAPFFVIGNVYAEVEIYDHSRTGPSLKRADRTILNARIADILLPKMRRA